MKLCPASAKEGLPVKILLQLHPLPREGTNILVEVLHQRGEYQRFVCILLLRLATFLWLSPHKVWGDYRRRVRSHGGPFRDQNHILVGPVRSCY